MRSHRVAILVLDGVLPLDFGIPSQVFLGRPWLPYRTTLCGERPQVEVATGYSLVVPGTLADVRRADTVIVPGFVDHERVFSNDVLDALRYVHRRGRRVVSICTGAFALAAAGVLDGLSATTHWRDADELAERYPQVTVDPNVLYVDNGQVLTSAGIASGIDLCLHIVRRDLGAAAANQLARLIVAAPHRDGGQTQFIETPVGTSDGSLSATRSWALSHLKEPLSVRDFARHAGVSERTVARRFVDETGSPPLQWL
ncbi:MAG TPA: DJ-1/PfpI family protein, partial [Acidothermaceae bacterium]